MLPEDPLFSSYYKMGDLTYKKGDGSTYSEEPCMESIDFGCRAGVIFSPRDLTCGGGTGTSIPRGERVVIDEARQVGANLLTYLLGNYQLARFLSSTKVYHESGKPSRDDFVFAQVVHEGDWDPDPSAVHNLLRYARDNSTMEVKFKRANVKVGDPAAATYPILYMTGHREFEWSREQVGWMRRYLQAGGILFADSCCGRMAFDLAFRRELAKVFDNHRLEPLDESHPLLQCHYPDSNGRIHAARPRGLRPNGIAPPGTRRPGRPSRRRLQQVRPGQRLGTVPPPLQLRAEGRIGTENRHEHAGVCVDALGRGVDTLAAIPTDLEPAPRPAGRFSIRLNGQV